MVLHSRGKVPGVEILHLSISADGSGLARLLPSSVMPSSQCPSTFGAHGV